jgi:hypothetical protein
VRTPLAELREKLEHALAEVTAAESGLEELLQKMKVAPRAEKVTVTTGIEGAFLRLRGARTELAKLRDLIKDD